jgi:hypothetical protein
MWTQAHIHTHKNTQTNTGTFAGWWKQHHVTSLSKQQCSADRKALAQLYTDTQIYTHTHIHTHTRANTHTHKINTQNKHTNTHRLRRVTTTTQHHVTLPSNQKRWTESEGKHTVVYTHPHPHTHTLAGSRWQWIVSLHFTSFHTTTHAHENITHSAYLRIFLHAQDDGNSICFSRSIASAWSECRRCDTLVLRGDDATHSM